MMARALMTPRFNDMECETLTIRASTMSLRSSSPGMLARSPHSGNSSMLFSKHRTSISGAKFVGMDTW